jgi:hypothetical protein
MCRHCPVNACVQQFSHDCYLSLPGMQRGKIPNHWCYALEMVRGVDISAQQSASEQSRYDYQMQPISTPYIPIPLER